MVNFEAEADGVICVIRDGIEVAKIQVTAGSTTSFAGEYTFELGAELPELPDDGPV